MGYRFTIIGFAYADGHLKRGLAANDPQATFWRAAILSLDWVGGNAPYVLNDPEIDELPRGRLDSFADAQASVNGLLARYPGSVQVIWTPREAS